MGLGDVKVNLFFIPFKKSNMNQLLPCRYEIKLKPTVYFGSQSKCTCFVVKWLTEAHKSSKTLQCTLKNNMSGWLWCYADNTKSE